MNRLQITDKYVARLIMVGFFLPMKWQSATVMGGSLYFALRALTSRTSVSKTNLLYAAALGGVFFLYLCSIPLTPAADRHTLFIFLGNRLSLLLLPLLAGIAMPVYGAALTAELKYFVYAALTACIVANIYFAWQFAATHQVIGPASHVAYRQCLEHVTGLHPTYLSLYLAFAICILLQGYVPGSRVVRVMFLFLLLLFMLALLAKAPLLAFLLISVHYVYRRRHLFWRYKFLVAGMLAAVIAACVFIPFIGQRLAEVGSFFGKARTGGVADNSVYVRKLIWDTDTGLLQQYWATGVGPGRLLKMLDYRYLFYSVYHNFATGYYDPHNEYFWQWLSFGITGLVVTVAVLLLHITRAARDNNYLYFYLLILLCITFCTESVLSRQQGVLFYAFFTAMFFYAINKKVSGPISR